MNKLLEPGIILSCQPAGNDESFYDIKFIEKLSIAAQVGGAVALRLEGTKTIQYIKRITDLPVIGLIKESKRNSLSKRNITVSIERIMELYYCGTDLIAVDFTFRENKRKFFYSELMKYIRTDLGNIPIVADISNLDEALLAEECGVNYISTTLSGYTKLTKDRPLPDTELLEKILKKIKTPIIAEGGYYDFGHLKIARELNCKYIVIGTALTRPHIMLKKYNKLWK